MNKSLLSLCLSVCFLINCITLVQAQNQSSPKAYDPTVGEWINSTLMPSNQATNRSITTDTKNLVEDFSNDILAIEDIADWMYCVDISITETSGAALTNYVTLIEFNSQELIAQGKLNPDASDLRFTADQDATIDLKHYIDSGLNTPTTKVWVEVPSIPANGTTNIVMLYGNPAATNTATLDVFGAPKSAHNQVQPSSTNNIVSNSSRGFLFSVSQDIIVGQFGKMEPTGTPRYVTLWDVTTQSIIKQDVVDGPAGRTYTYKALDELIHLETGKNYILSLFQGQGDGYYFGVSSQSGDDVVYGGSMRYCNNCTENTYPTVVLNNYHYGVPDFYYYTRNAASSEPSVVLGDEKMCAGLPDGWFDDGGIGCANDNNVSEYDADSETFTLTSGDCSSAFPYTSDNMAFVYAELCGNGEIVAEVSNVTGNGFAGIMIRENDDVASRSFAFSTNGVDKLKKEVRINPGYPAFPQFIQSNDKFFVKIVRNGYFFQGFASVDGGQWIPYMSNAINMSGCLKVGLFVTNDTPNSSVSADFTNVFVSGVTDGLIGLSGSTIEAQSAAVIPSVSIFPNPASDQLNISLEAFNAPSAQVMITNNIGQNVVQLQLDEVDYNNYQLDMSSFSEGVYHLQIRSGNQEITKKFVIAR
jgi:hypothetical protein